MNSQQKECLIVLVLVILFAALISYLPNNEAEKTVGGAENPTAYLVKKEYRPAQQQTPMKPEMMIFAQGAADRNVNDYQQFTAALKAHAEKIRQQKSFR